MNRGIKGAGFITSEKTHFIDHLAVICQIMEVPLIFLDDSISLQAKKYYPGLIIHKEDYLNFNIEYLISRYDVLFLSDYWEKEVFHKKYGKLEEKYKKTVRIVHCPHGFSDKGAYLSRCVKEDIVLVYGQNMLDMFKYFGVFEELKYPIMIGNYRLAYYKKHIKFYTDLINQEVLSYFDRKRPLIIYAPTWLDAEESSTFFDAYDEVIGSLPSDYNLIVKLHPLLEYNDNARYYQVIGKYENQPNVLFLKDFPLIYPLLAQCDLYIGDSSAVGYDFLAFNRPLFFLNKHGRDPVKSRQLLHLSGVQFLPDDYSNLYSLIEKHLPEDKKLFSQIRSELYEYTFGKERSFGEIKKSLQHELLTLLDKGYSDK